MRHTHYKTVLLASVRLAATWKLTAWIPS